MNVAELLSTRAAELSAFSSLLFRKRPRHAESDAQPTALTQHALYRRPSSANIPLSHVARAAKVHAGRVASSLFPKATARGPRGLKRRALLGSQWRLLMGRRLRRMALRRRPVAQRRRARRAMALLSGKPQLPLCRCGSARGDENENEENEEAKAAVDKENKKEEEEEEEEKEKEESGCVPRGRTALLWLPSHRQLSRRFHYRIEKIRLCAGGDTEREGDSGATVRLAVPVARRQKQHRVLQRFVSRLPADPLPGTAVNAHAKPHSKSKAKETALAPPTCIASDCSAACVWLLEPRRPLSAAEIADLLILRTHTGAVHGSSSTRIVPGDQWTNENGAVLHGYMWAGPLIAPVTLHPTPMRAGAFLLIAPAPVHMGRSVHAALRVRLVSHWNPCGAAPARGSVFELWCADAAQAAEWTQKCVDAGIQRWRRAMCMSAKASKQQKAKKINMDSTKAHAEDRVEITVMVFPSIPQVLATMDPYGFPLHRCAHTVLLLTGPRQTSHFRLARHLFAALSSHAPPGPQGFAPNVRIVGAEERTALLRLAGCAAFPGDMAPNVRCVPSNAHQRVVVKFAARGGHVHQCEGGVLLALTAPAVLTRIGFITSAPFFSMRFGCRIAHAWVWSDVGWAISQRYLDTGGVAEEKDNAKRRGEVAFFICAVERMRKLLPYMINPPTRVSRRPMQHTEKRSCQLETVLCDTDVCIAVELVRLGSTTHTGDRSLL